MFTSAASGGGRGTAKLKKKKKKKKKAKEEGEIVANANQKEEREEKLRSVLRQCSGALSDQQVGQSYVWIDQLDVDVYIRCALCV